MSGVSKMKVAELREALEARGLDTKGTKPFLVSRLEDAMSMDAAETEEKGRVKEMKETILAEAASPAPATPGRRSRRLSGEYAAGAGGTPARRRLLENVTASPSRLGSPARKTRRISGGDDRPSTPSRRSRRLSGCSADGDDEEAPQPPPTIPDVIQEVEEEEAGEEQVVKNTQNKDTEVATEEESSKEKPEDPAAAEHAEKTDSKTTGKSDPSDKPADKALESRNEELGNVEKTEEENKEVQVVKADKAEENQVINSRDEENVEEVKDEPVEIESEKSKIEKTVVEDSEKENMPSDEKTSDMDTNEKKTVEDDSFSSAACDIISSTNTLIANLRQEMASRNSLVAPKQIPRQKPKSGKFWKAERSAFRAIKKDKGQRLSFEQRLALKEEKVRNRDLAKTLLEQKNQKKEEVRKKIEENKAKKLENEKKAEQFQVVKNPAKIKRMKKKQLRQLEKRDIMASAD